MLRDLFSLFPAYAGVIPLPMLDANSLKLVWPRRTVANERSATFWADSALTSL